jgi:hypothetical protein
MVQRILPDDRLWNFYSVDDFRDDLVCGHILCLCLVSQTDTVTENLIAHRTYVLRNDIASSLDERICL